MGDSLNLHRNFVHRFRSLFRRQCTVEWFGIWDSNLDYCFIRRRKPIRADLKQAVANAGLLHSDHNSMLDRAYVLWPCVEHVALSIVGKSVHGAVPGHAAAEYSLYGSIIKIDHDRE